MNSFNNKNETLESLKEMADTYQRLVVESNDPIWEEALQDTLLEYALVKDLPEGSDFVVRRSAALILFGLDRSASDRLDRISHRIDLNNQDT